MPHIGTKQGQGTLEYILILSVILLAILAASLGIKNAVNTNVFGNASQAVTDAADAWKTRGGLP